MEGSAADKLTRRQAVAACESLLRILHTAVDCFGGDLDQIVIYLSVATASTTAALRDPEAVADITEVGLPDAYHRPISRRAIAASTGLPRETVRRKIAELVTAGRLVEEARGVRTRSGVLNEGRNLEFVRALLREIERSAANLARMRKESAD